MSTKLSSYVWDGCAAAGMKLSSVAIMARLADFSSDEGVCWPSIETIARQLGAGPSTVRTAIAKLETDGWLTRTARRKGNRNASNVYRLNVQKLQAAAFAHLPVSDASESDTSKFDGSKSSKKSSFHPPESGGDPSVNSKQDPSDKKTLGQPQAADQPQDDSLKIDYDHELKIDYGCVLAHYHELLPEMPVVLDLTDDRRKKLRTIWKKYEFTLERWVAYLRYISKHCRWMLENRPDSSTGKTWRKKNFDYLITEKCYLAVKEERANDLPKVAKIDNAERDEALNRLVSLGRKPKGRVEELAMIAFGKSGLRRANEVVVRAAWKSIWSQAVTQASEEDLMRVAS